jgi:hypothetical protein
MRKMTRQERLAYCAGLFDGEGCITISRYRKVPSGYVWPQLQVQVTQLRPIGLDFLIETFGGRRTPVKRRKVDRYWRWIQWSDGAVIFLEAVLPYLLEKREQALMAIKFQEHKNSTKKESPSGRVGSPGFSPEVFKIRNRFADKLSQLKRHAGAEH